MKDAEVMNTCPNSPSADLLSTHSGVGVYSLNRDRKPRVRERQSEEEEVSKRPQCERAERYREANGENLTLSWSP